MSAMTTNQLTQENENLVSINLIEEFMNVSEDEIKIISCLKDEFSELKFFNYGALIYMQEEFDVSDNNQNISFPHISELLQNYEKVYSTNYFLGNFIIRLTKCKNHFNIVYVTYNDGLVILSENGVGGIFNIFKIKNLVLMYNIEKSDNKYGKINFRILKVLKKFNLI